MIAKVKYVGKYNAAKKSIFLAGSLKKIGYKKLDVDTILFLANNQTAIKFVNNPVNHLQVKHINIQYYKMRELILNMVPKFDYIKTSKIVADRLIKTLTLIKYEYFVTLLGLAEKNKNAELASLLPPLSMT